MNIQVEQITPEKRTLPIAELPVFDINFIQIEPFDFLIISFLQALSKKLQQHSRLNRVPAFAALAFWLRKANITKIIAENKHLTTSETYKIAPRGLAFHICPSNVDTMFIYSLVVSLLLGNKNILRISQKLDQPIITTFFNILNELLQQEEYALFKQYINIVSYGHEDDINLYFSKIADVRIIWGGDETINRFKAFTTHPRCKDLLFADRKSFAIFNANIFLQLPEADKQELARKFFNDTYTFDQRGCSSPQLIFMLGTPENKVAFGEQFYSLLNQMAENNYETDINSLSGLKLNKLVDDAVNENINGYLGTSNYLTFAYSKNNLLQESCGGGYFYINDIEDIMEIVGQIDNKVQTVSFFGLNPNQINELYLKTLHKGIDRIVEVGKALDFNYIWDGYNLIEELGRRVTISKI